MSAAYHFVTRWRVEGTPEEVYRILDEPTELPRWWPAVYLHVEETATPAGTITRLHTKGWLPYTLDWQCRRTDKVPFSRLGLEAWGDFTGTGLWTFTADGPFVDVVYDWRVRAEKPLLRYLSFLLRPVFAANHRWAMARGEVSLRLELRRRRAASAPERDAVPPPPGPTTFGTPALLAGTGAVLSSLALLGWGLVRLVGGW